MNKKNDFSQKMHSYLRHPASLIMMILVKLAALITFTVLIFLIVYILVHGVPYLKPSLFSLHYNSENASLMPGADQYCYYDITVIASGSTDWYFFSDFPG